MKPSNLKVTFNPGFSVGKKILLWGVILCFLTFFSLVHAEGPGGPDNPFGEHPWDELRSGAEHHSPKPPGISTLIIFPCSGFNEWIIIHSPRDGDDNLEKGPAQINSSDKIQGRFFIFF